MTLRLTRRSVIAGTAAGLAMPYIPRASAQARTLRFSYLNAADHPQGQGARKFAELVGQKSAGKFNVRTFPSGQLGGDLQTVSAMQGGTIDFTVLNAGLLVGVIKEYGLYDLPFMFNGGPEADKVVDGPFGQNLDKSLPDKGLISLGYWELGFRHLTNSRRPITKLEEIQGLKIRVVQSPLYIDLFSALGANPVPMPFTELYTALEQKTVDGQENPVATILSTKLNEVQKYLTYTQHTYNPQIVLCSKKTWDSFSDAEKKAVMDAGAEARTFQRQVNRDNESKAANQLKASGMQLTTLTPTEFQRLGEKVKPVTEKYSKDADQAVVKALFDAIKKARG